MTLNSNSDRADSVKAEGERIDDVEAREHTCLLSDEERLQMLGYDAVLGRPLGFWSSAAMNVCHNSFIFEFISYTSLYGYSAPLVFMIGYPFLVILHLLLLGPFSELVSAFPVAGGMATWAWQCARQGIRGERQWGWLVSGTTLAMHLGKTIANLYAVTISLVAIYVATSPAVPKVLGQAKDPKDWWKPVFYLSLVTFVALLTMTRVARNGIFWMFAGALNLAVAFLCFIMLIVCAKRTTSWPGQVDWGFPNRNLWTHGLPWMIFVGLPLKITAVDCPIHMAEETRNPSRTVPRVMWSTTILHHLMVYVQVAMFIVIVGPTSRGMSSISPSVSMGTIMGIGQGGIIAVSIVGALCTITQVLASTVITSRFIFALARDHGIPFSNLLVKTNKHREPWIAMAALLVSLYLSTLGFLVDPGNYYGILQPFGFYFINLAYMLPLILYVTSHIDLRNAGRAEFSLRGFSKPFSWIVILWLLVSLIQGSFPVTSFSGAGMIAEFRPGRISFLPMVIADMLFIMLVSWLLYGRRHYIGPIRSLTKWSTGIEIDPNDLNGKNGRADAVKQYIDRETGRSKTTTSPTGTSPHAPNPVTPVRGTFSGGSNPSSPSKPSPTFQRMFGSRSSTGKFSRPVRADPRVSVLPESGVLPHETQAASVIPESGIFPSSQVASQDDDMAPAQLESQLMPEESTNLAARGSRRMTFRPSMLTTKEVVGEESYPLHQLPPPPRRNTFRPQQAAVQGDAPIEPAQQESQIEPSAYDSQFDPIVQEESQIEPSRPTESSFEPASLESQIHASQQLESFIEPAALQESQLEPRW